MADALLETRTTLNKGDHILHKDIIDDPMVKSPRIYKNRMIKTAAAKAEIRESFTNTLDGRGGMCKMTCEASPTGGEYFQIVDSESGTSTTYTVWFDTNGDGSTQKPTVTGTDTYIQADISGGATAANCATAAATGITAQTAFTSWSSSATLYICGASGSYVLSSVTDGDLGWSDFGTVHLGWLVDLNGQHADNNGTIGTIIGIDENGTETTENITCASAAAVNGSTYWQRINGVIADAAISTSALIIQEQDGTSLTFATIATGDTCTINARIYVPSGRHCIYKIKAWLIDSENTTAPVGAANIGTVYVEEKDEIVLTARPISVNGGDSVDVVGYLAGSTTQYFSLQIAEADTDATAFDIALDVLLITFG